MMTAILEDVESARVRLEKGKAAVSSALGEKLPEQQMEPLVQAPGPFIAFWYVHDRLKSALDYGDPLEALQKALSDFATASEPVRAAERKKKLEESKLAARAKAQAKAQAKSAGIQQA